jgi:thioredoxin-like negative regulator of GroEL
MDIKEGHNSMLLPGTYEHTLQQARSHISEANLDEAILLYERLVERLSSLKPELLKRRPELRDLHYKGLSELARLHHIRGNFERALALYRQLGEFEGSDRSTWNRRAAYVLIDMGRAEQGLDELRAEAMANPGDYEIWLVLGRECIYLKRWQEAEENLQRALRNAVAQESKEAVYLHFFDLYRHQGRVEEALAAWDQAWQSQPESANNALVYQLLIEHGQLERAQQYLERETNVLQRGFYQGLIEMLQGKVREAQRRWQKVADMNPLAFNGGLEEWAEAALRAEADPAKVTDVLGFKDIGDTSCRELVLWAIAEVRRGHMDRTERALRLGRFFVQRDRPRRDKIPTREWKLFDELVHSAEIKDRFRHFFETDQNGQPTS